MENTGDALHDRMYMKLLAYRKAILLPECKRSVVEEIER